MHRMENSQYHLTQQAEKHNEINEGRSEGVIEHFLKKSEIIEKPLSQVRIEEK